MIKYDKILLTMFLIALTFTASQLKAQNNEEIEKLYIGKWSNVNDKSDILTIEKLKIGYLVSYRSDKRCDKILAYISNGVLFDGRSYIYRPFPQPYLIDNENQLLLYDYDCDDCNAYKMVLKKFKKMK